MQAADPVQMQGLLGKRAVPEPRDRSRIMPKHVAIPSFLYFGREGSVLSRLQPESDA
jgi:hypothetical protein